MKMEERCVTLELRQEGKDMVEVVLGHLAKEVQVKEPKTAREFRHIINLVREDKLIPKIDCHTIWLAMDRKQKVEFPAQSYDENEAANHVMEQIEEKLENKPHKSKSQQ